MCPVNQPAVVSAKRAARILGISTASVYRLVKAGHLLRRRLPVRLCLIQTDSLLNYQSQQKKAA